MPGNTKISNIKSRFSPLFYVGLFFLGVSTLTRLVLYLVSTDASIGPIGIAGMFALGLLYDLVFLFYAVLPFVLILALLPTRIYLNRWLSHALKLGYFLSIWATGILASAEYLFWQEFSVRFNFIAVDYLVYRREVTDNIVQSYPVYILLFILFVVSIGVYKLLYRQTKAGFAESGSALTRFMIVFCVSVACICSYLYVGQHQRAQISDVYLRELASNGAYQFVAAFRNNELDYEQFYTLFPIEQARWEIQKRLFDSHARAVPNAPSGIERIVSSTGASNNYNVILITVESLSAKYMQYFGYKDAITPNLDALIEKSLFFTRMYATGTRTTRGLEAVTLSVPPTPGRSIIKRIGRETNLWSLGNVLREKNYDVRFIYGGRSYFDNMSAFFSGNGYDVIDQSSVPDSQIGFSNAWGMSDEDLFNVTISTAQASRKAGHPFFLHVMTTSNHRPYTYPKGRIDIPSGTGRDGAVMYTDYAIKRFLEQAETHDWFDNTLFVILADHTAGSAGKVDLPLDKYHIPMWIYAPGIISPAKNTSLISQIDVAPTILGLLDINYRSQAFGQDVLLHSPERALIANYEYLGYFDGRSVTVLKPNRKIQRYHYVQNDTRLINVVPMDESLRQTIAYYQLAAFDYHNKFLSWHAQGK